MLWTRLLLVPLQYFGNIRTLGPNGLGVKVRRGNYLFTMWQHVKLSKTPMVDAQKCIDVEVSYLPSLPLGKTFIHIYHYLRLSRCTTVTCGR